MTNEVSLDTLSKNTRGWYTAYTRVYPPNTPLITSTADELSGGTNIDDLE